MKYRDFGRLAFGLAMSLALSLDAGAQTKTEVHNEVRMVGMAGTEGSAQGAMFTWVSTEAGFEAKIIKGAPFSADTVTEFTQTLGNGQRIYRKSTASLYRDAEGRTRREQTIDAIGPYPAAGPARQTIMINDPVAGVSYMLDPESRTAAKATISSDSAEKGIEGGARIVIEQNSGSAGSEKTVVTGNLKGGGAGAVTLGRVGGGVGVYTTTKVSLPPNTRTESLGTQTFEGLLAEGTRTIETIPAGAIGNDTPIEIVSERWFSPELGVVVRTVRDDPMWGRNVYQLANIRRGNPDPSLFQVPADYTVKDAVVEIHVIKEEKK